MPTSPSIPGQLVHELMVLDELRTLAHEHEQLLETAYRTTVTVQEIAPRLAGLLDADRGLARLAHVDEVERKALEELRDALHDLHWADSELPLHRAWRAAHAASERLDDAISSVCADLNCDG